MFPDSDAHPISAFSPSIPEDSAEIGKTHKINSAEIDKTYKINLAEIDKTNEINLAEIGKCIIFVL